jgi:hypothetical protein
MLTRNGCRRVRPNDDLGSAARMIWMSSERTRRVVREEDGRYGAGVAFDPTRRSLQAAFYAGGAVATAAGLHTALTGGRSLPGGQPTTPSIESELRFYGAFYAAYGVCALRTAPQADSDVRAVRALAGALFLAGLARAGGWIAAGPPHPLQRALLAIELAAPPLVVALQRRAAS